MTRRPLHPLLWLTPLALLLRFLMFLGRGDYVAFDEGWYLLLGRSLMSGDGFRLSGLQHIALSPLFPILAGSVDALLDSPVASGRIVAAVTAALLVVPCWYIFSTIAGRRSAVLGCIFVLAMPALAPFVVPYWVGWDLWVGAEPVLHLFLYAGIALVLRGDVRRSPVLWGAAGVMFGLAYLARPEAILALGMTGLIAGALALYRHSMRTMVCAAVLGIAFAATAAPYWIYLHDVMGRWALTGRGIEVSLPTGSSVTSVPAEQAGPTSTIERMLWTGDDAVYVQRLYALEPGTTRLASTYWGVQPRASAAPSLQPQPTPAPEAPAPAVAVDTPAPAPQSTPVVENPPSRLSIYLRSISRVIPIFMLPLIVIGVMPTRRRRAQELLFAGPLVFMSLAIALVIASDPRTQLFLAPLAAFYIARGARRTGAWVEQRTSREAVSRRMTARLVAVAALALLFGTQARWLYMSTAVGSPHHIVGAENARMGAELQQLVPEGGSVMSWHPAIALYARRDWRVLPHATFTDIIRYGGANHVSHIVISPYYPGPRLVEQQLEDHVVVPVPAGALAPTGWALQLAPAPGGYLIGELRPAAQMEDTP